MSLLQHIFKFILPRKAFEAIERESKAWQIVCDSCGNTISCWELGGLRFGAVSKGKRVWTRCAGCGKKGMFAVRYSSPHS